jgi:hypothetical protein
VVVEQVREKEHARHRGLLSRSGHHSAISGHGAAPRRTVAGGTRRAALVFVVASPSADLSLARGFAMTQGGTPHLIMIYAQGPDIRMKTLSAPARV